MKTKLFEISFFHEFKCKISDCPYTCCRGWRIVFDEETYQRYLAEPGKLGRRLRSSIKKINGEVYFRASLKQCIFYEKGSTCQLQRVVGTDYMPLVCRQYPRVWQHFGPFAEEALFLSCPEAAHLFLEHLDDLEYVASTREVMYERWGTNDDEPYLFWLRKLRGAMICELWDTSRSLPQILAGCLAAMREIQQDFIDGKGLQNIPEIMQRHKSETGLHIHAQITDQMLTNGLYHVKLRRVSPLLYRLCRYYFSCFDSLTSGQADAYMDELRERLYRNHPEVGHMMRGYVVYYLQISFLDVYEDYSFVKKMIYGIMHMHMLELFLMLYEKQKNSLTHEELALLIAVYDRRGRHNELVAAGMYEKLYPAL